MRLIYYFILFFLFLCSTSFAQGGAVIDSLLQITKTNLPYKETVLVYIKIAEEYSNSDSANTTKYAQKAIELAEKVKYSEGIVDALCAIGWSSIRKGNYKEAKEIYENAKGIADNILYQKGQAKVLNRLGILNYYQSNYKEALNYYYQSLKINENIENKKAIASSYNNIGLIYKRQGDYKEALKIYNQSLAIEKEIDNKKGVAQSYNNMGVIYAYQGRYTEALNSYFNALEINKKLGFKRSIASSYNNIGIIYKDQEFFQKAIHYYSKSLEIKKELEDIKGIADCYNNIGNIYQEQGNYAKSLDFYLQSFKQRKKLGSKRNIAMSYSNIGMAYLGQKNYPKAKDYSFKALNLYEEIGAIGRKSYPLLSIAEIYQAQKQWKLSKEYFNKALIIALDKEIAENIRDAAGGLALMEKKLGNYQAAYEALELFKTMTDSLKNVELTQRLVLREAEYAFSQERDSITFTNYTKQLAFEKDIENRKAIQRISYIGLTLISFLLLIVFFLFQAKKRTNKLLTIKSKELESSNKEVKEQAEEIVILNKTLEQNLSKVEESLIIKNEKLSEYAYYNSHMTRAPITRILGLIQVLEITKTEEEKSILLEKIKESSVELESITKTMNHILEEANFFKSK